MNSPEFTECMQRRCAELQGRGRLCAGYYTPPNQPQRSSVERVTSERSVAAPPPLPRVTTRTVIVPSPQVYYGQGPVVVPPQTYYGQGGYYNPGGSYPPGAYPVAPYNNYGGYIPVEPSGTILVRPPGVVPGYPAQTYNGYGRYASPYNSYPTYTYPPQGVPPQPLPPVRQGGPTGVCYMGLC